MEETKLGHICNIQRLSSGDGPGMRTTIFFKGCPLRCAWCHNPETWSIKQTLSWRAKKCIGCGECVKICPNQAITFEEDGLKVDPARCQKCMRCAKNCPAKALLVYGKEYTAEALAYEACKDKPFYKNSGGGVTLSGGEVLMQADFAADVVRRIKRENIHVALDTSCFGDREKLLTLASLCDLLLVDIKLIDPARHKQMTAQDNGVILENIRALGDLLRERDDIRMWIRTPVIPSATDDAKNIRGIGEFIVNELPADGVEQWDLLLFHNMCRTKYRELWMDWPFSDVELITKSRSACLEEAALASGMPREKVHVMGLAVDD